MGGHHRQRSGPLRFVFTGRCLSISCTLLNPDLPVIMTRPEVRAGVTRNVVTSRPIPLDFLRLGSFSLPAETRKVDDEGRTTKKSILGIGNIFKDSSIPVYPFMINHASLHSKRRYTLYASSEGNRRKWREAFDEAIIIRRTQQDANRVWDSTGTNGQYLRCSIPKAFRHREHFSYILPVDHHPCSCHLPSSQVGHRSIDDRSTL